MISVFILLVCLLALDREVSAKIFACLVVYLATKMVISEKQENQTFNNASFCYWWF